MPTNFLFILIDDLGWTDLTCYGSTFYETPNLDRLAARGMRFTDAYASCPVCSPTRASIMTGKYPARVGITQFIGGHSVGRLCDVPYFHELPMQEYSLASALKDGGYQTWHVGKWHLGGRHGGPLGHGFEKNIGGSAWGMPQEGFFAPWGMPNLEEGNPGEYLTDRLTDEALRLLETRDPDRPFFLNYWAYAVHTPIQAPETLVQKYRDKARDLGVDKAETYAEGEYFSCEHIRDRRIRRRLLHSDPIYAAMVENLDSNLGRLFDALEGLGLTDETTVVFTSDNGGLATAEGSPTCNAPLREGKGWMQEGGNRVCQIMAGAGVERAGATCAVPVTSTDFYPTLLDLAGIKAMPEQHPDGVSLCPLLQGDSRLERDCLFWHYPHYSNQGGTPTASVRCGDWKLIEYFEDNHLELYHLGEDIGEVQDRAATETTIATDLHGRLRTWREDLELVLPRRNPRYRAGK